MFSARFSNDDIMLSIIRPDVAFVFVGRVCTKTSALLRRRKKLPLLESNDAHAHRPPSTETTCSAGIEEVDACATLITFNLHFARPYSVHCINLK